MTAILACTPGLLTPSHAYKPFRYPWAHEFWKRQQQVHWMPEEVPLGEDCKDWATKLNDRERNLLTQIFRFFTQSDVEVNDNYMERYARVFKPTEVKMMMSAFSNIETIHIAAYALLLETIGMPESEFSAFLEYEAMKDKHDYMHTFGVETHADIARTLAMFGAFTEGLQLFASFAMLLNFPRFNKMKGMGQIVSWSVRDESLHCEGMIKLYHAFNAETGVVTRAVADDIIDNCKTVVGMEDRFIDLAFEAGEVQGMTPEDIKHTSASSPTGGCASCTCRRSTACARTPCPGCRACSRAWSTPTSSRRGRPNTPRRRRRDGGRAATGCGPTSTRCSPSARRTSSRRSRPCPRSCVPAAPGSSSTAWKGPSRRMCTWSEATPRPSSGWIPSRWFRTADSGGTSSTGCGCSC